MIHGMRSTRGPAALAVCWGGMFACLLVAAVLAAMPAQAADSGVPLWTALGGDVVCGIAIHPPNSPPMSLLCSSPVIPIPKRGFGDGGNVFLYGAGRPTLERLSQDSFITSHETPLSDGTVWSTGAFAVRCHVSAKRVRCENHQRHGFTITRLSYRAF
jgi:hypothetical protein